MEKCQKCLPILHLGDDVPLAPEILQGVADSFYATMWINVLSSPNLWSALRRLPPKSFLIERIDAWLAFARNHGQYVFVHEEERAAMVEARSVPFLRLRALLVDWEPAVVTPEIREAAYALHMAEFLRPPDELREDPNDPSDIPLEAYLLWPEGEWDEEAFRKAHG